MSTSPCRVVFQNKTTSLFFPFFCPAQPVFLVFTQFATIPAGLRTVSLWISLDAISRLQLVSLQDGAGRFSGWILALDAVKRLLLVQGGAADVLRHCSLLHAYCSFPPETRLLALSLFPPLPLCIYYADTPSLCFPFSFSLISSLGPTFPSPLAPFLLVEPRLNCATLCSEGHVTGSREHHRCKNILKDGIFKLKSIASIQRK